MVLGPEEIEDKEIIPTREIYPDSQKTNSDYPYMYKQFAIQLTCGAISTKHALNNQWTIGTVLNGLNSMRNPAEMAMEIEQSHMFIRNQSLDRVEREEDFNDGYYTL
jgi:hypothetical protein